jgi:hypothetical protein
MKPINDVLLSRHNLVPLTAWLVREIVSTSTVPLYFRLSETAGSGRHLMRYEVSQSNGRTLI